METTNTSYNTAAPLQGKPVISKVSAESTQEVKPQISKATELLNYMVGNVGSNRKDSFADSALKKEELVAIKEGGADEGWGGASNPVSTTSSSETTSQEVGEIVEDFSEDLIEDNVKEQQEKDPLEEAKTPVVPVTDTDIEVEDPWSNFSFN